MPPSEALPYVAAGMVLGLYVLALVLAIVSRVRRAAARRRFARATMPTSAGARRDGAI